MERSNRSADDANFGNVVAVVVIRLELEYPHRQVVDDRALGARSLDGMLEAFARIGPG